MILVTGGAGFIGSMLVKALNEKGRHDIVIVDRLGTDEKWKNLRGLSFTTFIHADEFFAREHREHALISEIYHMGACSDTTEKDLDFLMKNNVQYSQQIFDLAVKNHARLIYASSAATYGDGEQGYVDNHQDISHLRPLNGYGYSKQLFDIWALAQKKAPPMWFGLKFFNVYGPQEYHKGHMRSVVYGAFQQIMGTGKVKLFKSYKEGYGDGLQKRDFIYVKDVCSVMIDLMALPSETAGKNSGIYNLGTGKARTFLDLAHGVYTAMDLTPCVEFIEMPGHLKNQYQYFTEADMSKLSKLLPHHKFMSLEDGVADYVKNYLHTTDPYC